MYNGAQYRMPDPSSRHAGFCIADAPLAAVILFDGARLPRSPAQRAGLVVQPHSDVGGASVMC